MAAAEIAMRRASAFENRVALRDMELADVSHFVEYWYRSSDAFLLEMGVNPRRMKPEAEFATDLISSIRQNSVRSTSKLPFLSIVLDGQVVGSHSVGDIRENESAVFHAHVWSREIRGSGLCTFTYPRAAKIFMDRFDLKEIVFKTPSLNVAANRIKEKLGLVCVGEEPITYPFMLDGLIAKIYTLDRAFLKALLGNNATWEEPRR